MVATSSSTVLPQHEVFINFRGEDLRLGFVSHLVAAMKRNSINVFMDEFEDRGKPLDSLFTRIEGSRVALAIFSKNYTESNWCLKEVLKMYECMKKGNLVVIPIFYKVEPSAVRHLEGDFGAKFWTLVKGDEKNKKQFEEALKSIPNLFGITVNDSSKEGKTVDEICEAVTTVLRNIPVIESQNASADQSETRDAVTFSGREKHKAFGIEQRLKELEDMLDCDKYNETRIIGVVGMPGIGKTKLIKTLFKKWERKFTRRALVDEIRVHSKDFGCDYLPTLLLEELLGLDDPQTENVEDPYEMYKCQLLGRKVLVILDDVNKREQIDALLGKRDWISKGSRIIIATSDASLTNGLVDDTYVVQNLDHGDSLQLFYSHAFSDDQANPPNEDFRKLSEEVVHYARGHPLALNMLAAELNKKNMDHWKSKLEILAQSTTLNIGSVIQVSYDELTSEQKDAFLDIACFRSESVDYVVNLLASSDLGFTEAVRAVKVLTDKFFIHTCGTRVEMHDLLYNFSRELDSKASTNDDKRQKRRLWLHQDVIKGVEINALQNKMKAANVRGIFLDLSEVKEETSLDCEHLKNMRNLRYLKFYNSHCPQECETKNKINIPDGLELPLKEIRCLHWLKFPLKELPNDFEPSNLVDLKLPYSEIEQLWKGDKKTSRLKWVDLNHSSKLKTLSGLSKAEKLRRLNLEGCKALDILPGHMEGMESLVFLNLKGCTSLKSLPKMNLISLKSLTLSGCSSLNTFPLVSECLETLYLDGTAVSQFPEDWVKLKRLVLLNMKDCTLLETIPDFVTELEALQELILSGCFNLKVFPETGIRALKILFLDGTAIEAMPLIGSLQYLCLSRNDKISFLPDKICELFQLKWLDLKYCTSLTSLPKFPPNLQFLDAHGCISLKTIKPLARIMPNEQNRSTFIFTNCVNLEQAAKEEITLYAQRKCQMLSDARTRYKGGLISQALFSTSYPGWEIPSWICHEAVGSVLEVKLPPHCHGKRLAGIAFCAVVSFGDCQNQINSFSVKCIFKLEIEDKAWIPFTCPVGSWTRQGEINDKIEPYHVFIGYTSSPPTINCLEDKKPDNCKLTKASLEFSVTGETSEVEKCKVLRCGLSLLYA